MKNYYQKRSIILDVKQLTLLIGLLLGNLYAHAQAPDFAWARQSQINNNNTLVFTRGIAHDNQGNSYVTGFFRGSVTFGSNTSTSTTLTSSGVKKNSSGSWDTYVAKYDASGNLVWTKQSGGVPFNIAVDGLGNIYITGNFDGRAKFGSTTLSTNGGVQAVFVVKYDANGVVQWAKQSNSTGIGYASASSIAVDGLSNCYITGSFVKNATFGSTTLTENGSSSSRDIFVVKYDASGNMTWAKNAGGTGTDIANGIAVDGHGNSYVTGYFSVGSGSAVFGNILLTNSGSNDIFVAKFKADDGTVLWAKQAGGTGTDRGSSIAVDGNGNIYITGGISGSATFGSVTLTGGGTFRVKCDNSGNVVWAKNVPVYEDGFGTKIAIDASGNSYMTGWFSGSVNFGSTTLTSNGSEDIFVAKFDPDGDEMWAKKAGGIGNDRGSSITLDGSGNSYITGSFNGSATFGSTPNNITLTSTSGGSEVFIAKLNSDNVSARYAPASAGTRSNGNVLHIHKLNAYPNPFTTKLTMELFSNTSAETAIVTLTTIAGKTVYQQEVKLTNGRVSEELDDLSRLPVGMYFLRLQLGDKPLVLKMMKH